MYIARIHGFIRATNIRQIDSINQRVKILYFAVELIVKNRLVDCHGYKNSGTEFSSLQIFIANLLRSFKALNFVYEK